MNAFLAATRRRSSTPLQLWTALPLLFLLDSAVVAWAQFDYVTNNNVITITGYTGPAGNVMIPSTINDLPVTQIGTFAFAYNGGLTSVTIPASVTNLAEYAFAECKGLTNVTTPEVINFEGGVFGGCTNLTGFILPSGMTSIPDGLFGGCTRLASITIPDGVTYIGTSAFASCLSLHNVVLPDSVTTLARSAFSSCTSLTNIVLPNSIKSIGVWAFADCRALRRVVIPEGVTLEAVTFSGCSNLTEIILPSRVEFFGGGYFYACTSLTNVSIPNGWPYIPNNMFFACSSLTNVTIGYGVTNIASRAFDGCPNLASIHFGGDAPSLDDIYLNSPGDGIPNNYLIVHYLPGTAGWGTTFGGCTTAQWLLPYPIILNYTSTFGLQNNQFGFMISWATNALVAVEACTNLSNPVWETVQTSGLVNGSLYFNEPVRPVSSRAFRVRSP